MAHAAMLLTGRSRECSSPSAMRPRARITSSRRRMPSASRWHGSRDCGGPSLFLPPLPLLPCHWFPLDKEHPRQPAFAERLAEDAEGEIRNEHQQHDEIAGECFLQPDASELAKRSSDRPMVKQADDGFLDDGQD